jgi:exopolysaccharide biosynthesis polyprenyl glycosylphosphotransferase
MVGKLRPFQKLMIMILDLLIFLGVLALVFWLRLGSMPHLGGLFLTGQLSISLMLMVFLYVLGAYDLDSSDEYLPLVFRQLGAIVFTMIVTAFLTFLLQADRSGLLGRGVLLGALLLFIGISIGYRYMIFSALRVFGGRNEYFFLVDPKSEALVKTDIEKAFLRGKFHFLQDWKSLESAALGGAPGIILASSIERIEESVGTFLVKLKFQGTNIVDLSGFYEKMWRKIPVHHLSQDWFILAEGFNLVHQAVLLRIKRLLDLSLALLLLFFAWPFMLLTAIAVKLDSPGPVFYSQIRTGKGGSDFAILKFRSMRTDAEKHGAQWASKNDSRVTMVGKFIRLTRLDELPQLFTVLKGDMSFIGPRPERPEFNKMLSEQIPFYDLRHLVRPGITGWAQVMYPYGASVDDAKEKLQYDLYYIKNHSLFLDFVIILKTVSVVLLGKGR